MISTYARIGYVFGWVLARAVAITALAGGLLAGALYLLISMIRAIRFAAVIVSVTW